MALITVQIEEVLLAEFREIYNQKIYQAQYNTFRDDLFCSSLFLDDNSKNTLLASYCDAHGSDKGSLDINAGGSRPYPWLPHTYTDFYSLLFDHCRKNIQHVFECGIGTNNLDIGSNMTRTGKPGASLRVWRDYFPNAQIIGVDIDKEILFSEERIQTYYIDQMNKLSIQKFWHQLDYREFDLMVDDGLHTFEAGIILFENAIDYLKNDGVYIIEDVSTDNIVKYKQYFKNKKFKVQFFLSLRKRGEILNIDSWPALADNSLVFIKRIF